MFYYSQMKTFRKIILGVFLLFSYKSNALRCISSTPITLSADKKPKSFMIDIDGTICSTPNSDYNKCLPKLYNIALFNKLYDQGHSIHYWTARGANSKINWDELTLSQLKKWKVKYTTINMDKPHYDVWVDDKAVNTHDVSPMLLGVVYDDYY